MLEQIMAANDFDYLGRGLKAANLRQEVIANNLANVNTPKFKRSSRNFWRGSFTATGVRTLCHWCVRMISTCRLIIQGPGRKRKLRRIRR